jgi:hypothetical protein
MAQRSNGDASSAPRTERAVDPAGRIGDYVIRTSLRRDDLGEVCAATGAAGEVRIRLVTVRDADRFDEALAAVEAVAHPAIAPTFERLVAGGATALVGPPDRLTLADRRRRGVLPRGAAVAAGATLLEGLAALHAAATVHGAVDPGLAGIDADGHPRWRDAGVWAAQERGREPARGGRGRRAWPDGKSSGGLAPQSVAAPGPARSARRAARPRRSSSATADVAAELA